jgi:serine protease
MVWTWFKRMMCGMSTVTASWTRAPNGSNRTVCIIDTGFMISHKDLEGVSVTGYNGDLPCNQDGHGHGTHVAGTIAAINNHVGVVGVTLAW